MADRDNDRLDHERKQDDSTLTSELIGLAKKIGIELQPSDSRDVVVQRLKTAAHEIEDMIARSQNRAGDALTKTRERLVELDEKVGAHFRRIEEHLEAMAHKVGIGAHAEAAPGGEARPTARPSRVPSPPTARRDLADLDQWLPELPDSYGDNRLTLMPRDPRSLFAYWDVTNEHKERARREGGRDLVLRLYDVTDLEFDGTHAHGHWDQAVHELARTAYLSVPVPGRSYLLELGYVGAFGQWFALARSSAILAPTDRPSERVHDVFVTIPLDRPLAGPRQQAPTPPRPQVQLHEVLYQAAGPAGIGASLGMSAAWAERPAAPWQIGWSGVPWSGGFGPSLEKGRQFWLRADAELIVYGATEPDAELTIAGQAIPLRPDGTFYIRIHFPDGVQDFPIQAVAADKEQRRSIHLNFNRRTE